MADLTRDALEAAAAALEAQPPMTRAHYVQVLRLYAAEPWRMTRFLPPTDATHGGNHAPLLPAGPRLARGFCPGCDALADADTEGPLVEEADRG